MTTVTNITSYSKLFLSSSSSVAFRSAILGPLKHSTMGFHSFAAQAQQKQLHENWTQSLADPGEKPSEDHRFCVSWEHAAATTPQLRAITISHHTPKTRTDKIANFTLQLIRKSFDFFTGYHHPPKGKENDPRYQMSEKKWLERFVFLESIAGVPGMVGGMVRHLHSLRLMRRDKAWIETLLEEAYNERMHLLTFMKLLKPGVFMRFMLLGAQGVFFNIFFVAYLMFPRVCHRFVGYLEEEAIVTYTRCIEDIESGRLSDWKTAPAPEIALSYWHMKPGSTMLDLIYYVRADEAKHREVNHTFGNLKKEDRNPYALMIVDDKHTPQPSADFSVPKPTGWERRDIAA